MADDFITSAIDRVIGLAPAKLFKIDDFVYIDKDKTVTRFQPPVAKTLTIHTLSGFVELLETGFEGFDPKVTVVQVSAFDKVELIAKASDTYGRRQVHLDTEALNPERTFAFNTYIGQEQFNIALRSMFVQDDDLDALVALAGSIAHNTETRQEDDGFSQTVAAKAGNILKKEITLKPRVTLRPFRTFLEVAQPSGEFIFRVRNREGYGNELALFEADAGQWKLTAMETIAAWLKQKISTSDVESIRELPVIA